MINIEIILFSFVASTLCFPTQDPSTLYYLKNQPQHYDPNTQYQGPQDDNNRIPITIYNQDQPKFVGHANNPTDYFPNLQNTFNYQNVVPLSSSSVDLNRKNSDESLQTANTYYYRPLVYYRRTYGNRYFRRKSDDGFGTTLPRHERHDFVNYMNSYDRFPTVA